MMPDIIVNVVNIISIFFIRMILTAVITAPLIIFSAAISCRMKAPRRYAYRMWCMTGAAVFLLIAGSAVSMLPSGVLSQLNEAVTPYTDVQNTDFSASVDGNAELKNEMSDASRSQVSESKISESADVTVNSASDGRSSVTVSGYDESAASPAIPEEQRFKQHKIISSALSAAARVSSLEADLTSGKYSELVGAAGALYILAALFMIFINAARYVSLRRKLKTACLVKSEDRSYAAGSGRLKNSKVMVFESSDIAAPFTLGVVRPAVFIPVGMDRVQTDNVLRHELAHTARRDQLKMSAAVFIAALLWFDPLVWLAVSMFRRDMELSCDDIAVKDMNSEARSSYAKVLLDAAPVGAVRYGSAVFMSDRRYFESRVMNILNNDKGNNNAGAKSRRTAAVAVSVILCAVVLVAGGVALSVMHSHSGNEGGNFSGNNYGGDAGTVAGNSDYKGIQKKLDDSFAKFTESGINVNAVMLDYDGNVIASIGDTEISAVPGAASLPLTAAVLMENHPDCMEMKVPSDGFDLSDGSRIKNWLQAYHDGEDITFQQALGEMSKASAEYALINADDATVEKLKEFYDPDSLADDIGSESDEFVRLKLASGEYSIKLNDMAGAMLQFMGDSAQQGDSVTALDTQQRAELRELFRQGLSWYFQYKVDKEAEYYHLSLQEAQYAAENTMISSAFGTTSGHGDNENMMQSVCTGYGAYNGKPVYFAVSVETDPLSSVVPVVFGDAVAYHVNNVFLPDAGGDARQPEHYRKSMSFDISAVEPYEEVTAWNELELDGGDELVFSGTWTPDAAKVKLKIYLYDEGSGAYEPVYNERTVEQGAKCRIPVNDDGRYRIDLDIDYPITGGTLVLNIK